MTAHWFDIAESLAIAAAILFLAAAAGWRAAGALLPGETSRALKLVFAAALGAGLTCYLTLAAGLAGFVSAASGVAVLALLAAVGLRDLPAVVRGVAAFKWPSPAPAPSVLGVATAVAAAVSLLVALLGAFAPPVYYDSLVYHLSVPKLYLLRGAIAYLPENVHSQYPSTLQMLNLLALEVSDDIAAQLLHYGLGIFLALAVFLFGRRFAGARVGAWAAALLLTTEAAIMTFCRGMIDPGVTLFAFLAFFALALWEEGGARERRLLLLAGILGGLAISSKYTTWWLWALLAGSVLFVPRPSPVSWRTRSGDFATVALPSAAVLAPWLLKTWSATGNPIFPFLFGVFGGKNWSDEAAARLAAYNAEMGGHMGWEGIWRLPLELFFVPGSLENLTLGPLWLLALPFVLSGPRRPRAFAYAAWIGLLYLPYWFASARILRYLVLLLPLFALVYAERFAAAPARSFRRFGFGAALLIALGANLWFLYADEVRIFQPVRVALGLESREAYLGRMLQSYPMQAWASRELPRGAKVLFVGETRAYHLERDHIANSAHDPQLIVSLVRSAGGPAAAAQALRVLGVTHVLFNPEEMERLERAYGTFGWTVSERAIFGELLARELRLLVRTRSVQLYAVPAARNPELRPSSESIPEAAR